MRRVIEIELFKYGFYPLLLVMERCSKVEDFEMCKLIMDVIQEHNEKYKLELPTKLNEDAEVFLKLAFMVNHNSMGEVALANSEHYADDIQNTIEDARMRFDKTPLKH